VLLLLCWKYTRPTTTTLRARKEYEALLAEADAVVEEHHNRTISLNAGAMAMGAQDHSGLLNQKGHVSGSIGSSSSSSATPMIRGLAVYRDIVVGMAMNTDPKNFVVFCATLRAVSSADVLVFVNMPIDARLSEIAVKYRITLTPFDVRGDAKLSKYHPSTIRWDLMKKYLQQPAVRNKYGRVWMIDVRDSMFQSDPFKMLPVFKPHGQPVFLAFKGVESMRIVECGWNGGWVKDCFGQDRLNTIGNNYIICSGVSAGTIDAVLPYLDKMGAITMGEHRRDLPNHKFPQCERNGVDQGAHNVLVHSKLIAGLKVLGQAEGPVANMQAKLAIVRGGKEVFNKKGEKYAVVHQYDRHPVLQKHLFRTHVYWTDTDDPMAEWAETAECKGFGYTKDVDMFRGRCDLKNKGGATGPASCCKMCADAPACEAFTYTLAGTCFLKSCGGGQAQSSRGGSHEQGALSAYALD
jgi:hypothetical protein